MERRLTVVELDEAAPRLPHLKLAQWGREMRDSLIWQTCQKSAL